MRQSNFHLSITVIALYLAGLMTPLAHTFLECGHGHADIGSSPALHAAHSGSHAGGCGHHIPGLPCDDPEQCPTCTFFALGGLTSLEPGTADLSVRLEPGRVTVQPETVFHRPLSSARIHGARAPPPPA